MILEFNWQLPRGDHRLEARGIFHFAETNMVIAVRGESGVGKTSFLRWLAGLDPVRGSSLRWEAEVWQGPGRILPPRARRVALVAQGEALFPHLGVGENTGFALRHLPAQERRQRTEELLSLVGMPGFFDRPIQTLSGGQKRRVALAQALAARPRLLLLDEPFSGLDVDAREGLAREVGKLVATEGVPTILVTHDRRDVEALGAREVKFEGGALIARG